ncbi:MAG TPA: hypothetical protein DDY68_03105 [Porphyromonadaceae bacterium]|nr:hypothetical protein [Porphyromonadaceae bacterium]
MGKILIERTKEEILSKMMAYCSRREVAPYDAKEKIKCSTSKGEVIASVLNSLIKGNYINEERYTEAFVHDKIFLEHWSKKRVSWELRGKEINTSYVERALDKIPQEEYQNSLFQLLCKKRGTLKDGDWKEEKTRLKEYALRKGFDFETITIVLSQMEKMSFQEE